MEIEKLQRTTAKKINRLVNAQEIEKFKYFKMMSSYMIYRKFLKDIEDIKKIDWSIFKNILYFHKFYQFLK